MIEPQEIRRPAPVLTEDNRIFWESALDRRLVAQRCVECGRLRHPPGPMCPDCHSLKWETLDLKGLGTIYSYAILHHPQNPAFEYPVIAALVDLDEGVRVASNVIEIEPQMVKIGLRVMVDYLPTKHNGLVPIFRPNEVMS